MKRLYVDLHGPESKTFLEQLSKGLFYHFFRSEKRYSHLCRSEKGVIAHYQSQLVNFPNRIDHFCQFFHINIKFWVQVKKNDILHQIESLDIGSNHTMNLLVINYKCPYKFESTQPSENLNFFKLGFIPDVDRFPSDFMNKTIFELLGKRLGKSPIDLEAKWKSSKYGERGTIKFSDEKYFGRMFGVGFTVISVADTVRRHGSIRYGLVRHHNSKFDDFLLLKARKNFHGVNRIDYKNDRFNLRETEILFECSTENCPFAATEPHALKRHMTNCEPGPKKKYIQRDMCAEGPRKFLLDEGFLPEGFRLKEAVFYDIESFAVSKNIQASEKTQVLSTQKLVTISVTSNFGNSPRTKIFRRDSYEKEDYVRILREFTAHLKYLQCQLLQTLPEEVNYSIVKIEDILDQNRKAEKSGKALLSVKRRSAFQSAVSYLKSLQKLRVFGFNSERYDLTILLPGLIDLWGPKNISVIRRNAGYMMLESAELRFLDVKNYLAGGSLASFANAWGEGCEKQIFPYQFFETISQAKNCTTWPKYTCFRNDLSYKNVDNIVDELREGFSIVSHRVSLIEYSEQMECPEIIDQSVDNLTFPDQLSLNSTPKRFSVSPIDYCKNWEYYEELYALGQIENMFMFLEMYNRNDTEILTRAFGVYCEKFWETFNVNPLEYFSLSHMSESIMFSEFDVTVNRAYSLGDGSINQLIRDNQRGGLVIIFHRHAIANADPLEMLMYDKCVWSLRNNQIIRKIICYDFNALYAAAMRLFLPTGYGFKYDKGPNGFKWTCLKTVRGFSLQSLEWIQYVQTLYPFTQADGTIHHIRHALNGQEHETRLHRCLGVKYSDGFSIFADGHVVIGGHQYFLFFDGCRYHKCGTCDTNCISDPKRDERRNLLLDLGTVIEIKGCEWVELKKTVSYKNSISHFFNRKKLISEQELFHAIKSGDLFGLIQVDIRSPNDVVKKWSRLNFPLIPRHQDIDESMIAPNIVTEMKDKGYQFPIKKNLTLCFNAKAILITTEMARFYFDQGCILSNIHTVIEFQRATPLKDFVNKATKERIAATRDNNDQKQDLYKRIVNASYGRTGMRQDNRFKIKYEKYSRNKGSKLVKRRVPLVGEFETDLYEVTKEPAVITDQVPGNDYLFNLTLETEIFP